MEGTTATTTTTTTTTTVLPKFSRYLSVRKKKTDTVFDTGGDGPQVQLVASHAPPLAEPPSRYRRRNNGVKATTQTAPAIAPAAAANNGASLPLPFPGGGETRRRKEHPAAHEEGAYGPSATTPPARSSDDTPPSEMSALEAAREEARMILEGEYDRLQLQKQIQQTAAPDPRRRRNLTLPDHRSTRPEQEDARSAAVSRSRSHRQPAVRQRTPPDSFTADRRAQAQAQAQAQPSRTRSHARHHVIGGSPSQRNPNGPPVSHQRDPRPPEVIPLPQIDAPILSKPAPHKSPEPAPAFDAPVSAINAADRQVTVSCHKSTITLPVIPTTTTSDILKRASELMPEKIEPRTAILLENFSQLRLERPLRRYERIRDVMNGWHNDSHNQLVIMPASECAAVGLELADAPTSKPDGVTVYMYHSSRPGHWAKKWVRLREDGQMCVSSKESFADGSSTNICHLSDFDLYTPTPKQRKALHCPKKICFAVKSQQKSSTFLSGQNFVHFLASNSQDVANDFYKAVWGWRSWYLIDVLGEGADNNNNSSNNKKLTNGGPHSWRRSLDATGRPFSPNGSNNNNIRPLVDLSELRRLDGSSKAPDHPSSRGGSFEVWRRPSLRSTSPPARRPTTSGARSQAGQAQGQAPPTSFPRKLVLEATNVDHRVEPVSIDDEAFTGKGLLARHASTKSQPGGGRPRTATGTGTTGRWIKGKEGQQPLLDLTKESEFVDGSLLRRLEAQTKLGLAHNNNGHDASSRADWD